MVATLARKYAGTTSQQGLVFAKLFVAKIAEA
jgi:hypothetical protein